MRSNESSFNRNDKLIILIIVHYIIIINDMFKFGNKNIIHFESTDPLFF